MTWQPLAPSSKVICPTEGCGGVLMVVKSVGFCMKCQHGFERPKVVHKHRTKKAWTPEDIKKIVEVGLKDDPFGQMAVRTLFALDLRRAELVGGDDPRRPKELLNPGLRWENVRDDGIWIKRKMHQDFEFKKNPELVKQLRDFFGPKKEGKIFDRSTTWIWITVKNGAKKAGFQDWQKMHPHRIRASITTWTGRKHGVIVARDTAGHKSIATTNTYLDKTPDDVLEKVTQEALDIV